MSERRDDALAAIFTARGVAVLVRHAASDTEAIDIGLNHLHIVRIAFASRMVGLSLSMVIILTAFVIGRQSVSGRVDLSRDLNETSGRISLIIDRGNETRGHSTSTGSVDVRHSTEGHSVIFAIGNGVHVCFSTIVCLVSWARGQKQAKA
jgi:hypothetical protein